MTPAIYVALAGLAVIGGWLLINTSVFVSRAGN